MAASRNIKARKRKRITCKHIADYMRIVEKEQVPVCEDQKLLIAYVKRVFAEEELIIDTERDERYSSYEELWPFKLYPWEWFCFTLVFCVFKKDGRPRWPELLAVLGRGAGKNGLDGWMAFCATTSANGIPEYDVDICANTEDQAMTSFNDVKNALENPRHQRRFRKGFRWTKTYIQSKSTLSTIRFRTDNPKSKDGLRSGMVIFDEIHAYENWDNINVFTTGLGKKPHPRIIYTTTQGDVRDGVLDSYMERAEKILRGEEPDNGLLPFICRLDSKDEVHDERMWVKANPSLPYKPDLLDQMRREYVNYKNNPAKNASFMTKRMNIPEMCREHVVAKWDDILRTNQEVPDLSGEQCVCGIDFAKTSDMIGACLLFRKGGKYFAVNHAWFCKNSNDAGRIKFPLDEAERAGYLTIVDDVEVHPRIIADWVYEQSQRYNIVKIGIDMYRHTLLKRELEANGFNADKGGMVKTLRPSDIMLAQPKIDSVFVNGSIAWGDNKLMRWFTNNTKLVPAPNGNFKYDKIEPFSRKTDGFMAFVAAMCVEEEISEYAEPVFMEPLIFS